MKSAIVAVFAMACFAGSGCATETVIEKAPRLIERAGHDALKIKYAEDAPPVGGGGQETNFMETFEADERYGWFEVPLLGRCCATGLATLPRLELESPRVQELIEDAQSTFRFEADRVRFAFARQPTSVNREAAWEEDDDTSWRPLGQRPTVFLIVEAADSWRVLTHAASGWRVARVVVLDFTAGHVWKRLLVAAALPPALVGALVLDSVTFPFQALVRVAMVRGDDSSAKWSGFPWFVRR